MVRIPSQRSIASLKSWLFTPATKSDRFSRAATVHADALIIDLEDAVAPFQRKRHARQRFAILPRFPPTTFPLRCRSSRATRPRPRARCRASSPGWTAR